VSLQLQIPAAPVDQGPRPAPSARGNITIQRAGQFNSASFTSNGGDATRTPGSPRI